MRNSIFPFSSSPRLTTPTVTLKGAGSWRGIRVRELYIFSVILGVYALVVLSANREVNECQDLEQRARAFSACPAEGVAHRTVRKLYVLVQAFVVDPKIFSY